MRQTPTIPENRSTIHGGSSPSLISRARSQQSTDVARDTREAL